MNAVFFRVLCCICAGVWAWPVCGEIRISPARVTLTSPEASQQLLVTETQGATTRDLTRSVLFQPATPGIVEVDSRGLVRPIAEGVTNLNVTVGNQTIPVEVSVTGLKNPQPVSFEYEILPVLTKSRCNSGGCHGKAEGQGGFKFSLLGFDADFDYEAIVDQGRGRRISLTQPEKSLLLRKGSAQTPHGGGLKLAEASPGYHRVLRWLETGAPRSIPNEVPIVKIVVEPPELVLAPKGSQQLRVTAIDAAGNERCATMEADYISNAGQIIEADNRGLLQAGEIPGDAAVLVRYLGHVSVCRVIVPRPTGNFPRPPDNNFIDGLVWNKLQRLGIEPSPLADDATFLRRVYLDTIGTLPTVAEARAFLSDTAPDKRAKLVDSLLQRPEYATYWALRWSDILRADKIKVTHQGTVGLTRWLRRQFAQNRPYDAMVREILTVQGPVQSESPAPFFRAVDQPEVASRAVSQLFLGVRIECAQCHHHPSERWSQDDYAGFAGFFTGVSIKKLPDGTDAIVAGVGSDTKHPRTGLAVPARALGVEDANFTNISDRRVVLANWLTAPTNPFFARAIANRLWAHYLGRGLVTPIDDLRTTNPATNEPLLEALTKHLVDTKFDLKAFTRTILNSRVYQLSSATTASNEDDQQHFSHASSKALEAEVLLDAICQSTGVPEKFNGWPEGTRSLEIWDNRMPSYFFRIFGRPVRATVCECERSNEPSISQALHLLNSPEVNEKITHRHGFARGLAESSRTPDEIVDEITLSTLSRLPTPDERVLFRQVFERSGSNRRQAVEDVLWGVLNTKEFLFNN